MPIFGKSKEKSETEAQDVSKIGNNPREYLEKHPEAIRNVKIAEQLAHLEKTIREMQETVMNRVEAAAKVPKEKRQEDFVDYRMADLEKLVEGFDYAMKVYNKSQSIVDSLDKQPDVQEITNQ